MPVILTAGFSYALAMRSVSADPARRTGNQESFFGVILPK